MAHRIRFDDGKLVLYRDPWSALGIPMLFGLCCLAVGSGVFYWAVLHHESLNFFYMWCGFFVLVGLMLCLSVASHAQHVFRNGGWPQLVVDEHQIQVSSGIGMALMGQPWSMVTDLVLTDRLKRVSGDEDERGTSSNLLLVMLKPEAWPEGSPWKRLLLQSQLQLGRSGRGLPYRSASCPRQHLDEVYRALRRVAPSHVRTRRCSQVEFDYRERTERYTDIIPSGIATS